MASIDSCEYIWEAGVGFAHSPQHNVIHDHHRAEILKLLLTCFSETMYLPPVGRLAENSFYLNPYLDELTLLLLSTTCPILANSVDPDQLASGSALFVIKYVNFYQKSGSSNLIGWKVEVGVVS